MKHLKSSIKILLFVGLTPFIFSNSKPIKDVAKENEKPNIVLIYMDDMGYGDLECYGNPIIRTPNINRLAERGIRFTSFYAPAAVCTPSRAGLLTGKYPVRTTPFNFGPESKNGLPLSETTLADVLQEAGYRTGAIGKWHLGHMPEYLPTARGFSSFYGLPYSNDMILPWCPWLSADDKLMLYEDSIAVVEIGKKQENLTLEYSEKAIAFIKNKTDEPFFLYLAHSMPHLPIDAAERFKGVSNGGLYGDVIEMVDWTVGELIKTLEQEEILDNTLIIFTSDNGPWHNLPERMLQDGVEEWHTGSTGPFRGAKATTYEGGFRVPAIMHWPDQISAGQVNRELVTALDIFPSIVEISGASNPEGEMLDGMSLFPLLKGKEPSPRNTFIYCKENIVQAIRKNEWKFRYTEKEGAELYDLEKDPGEQYNRAEEFPKISTELLEEMQEFAKLARAEIYEKN